MQQVSKAATGTRLVRPPDALGADELGAMVSALYDVANHARRATPGDPVEPAGLRVLVGVQSLGSPRMSEVAQELKLDLSVVSRHVRSLSADGLLSTTPDPEDKRAQRVSLTAEGTAAIHAVVENRRAAIGSVLAGWPEEDMTRLTELLRRLADDLAELNR